MPNQYQRPQIPYNPIAVLPFSNRYELTANQNQPISSSQLDGDANYIIDSMNLLYAVVQGIAAGVIPGSSIPTNIDKFPITDGTGTISWSQITEAYFSARCIPTGALQLGCVTNPILGTASVQNSNIETGAVQNNSITDNTLSFGKVANENNLHFQLFFNSQDNATLSGAKIQAGSLPANTIAVGSLPGAVITPGTLPAASLVANSITNAQLAPVVQIRPGMMMDWAPGGAAPAGWLLASGQAINRITYALLYAAIGTTYGIGDGATTFNLPDTRGVAIFGIDPTSGSPTNGKIVNNTPALGSIGGSETVALTGAQNGPHTHSYDFFRPGNGAIFPLAGTSNTPDVVLDTTSSGTGAPHNNMPPYLLMPKIIYAGI